ncbi:MAG: acetyltransferase [Belnapia sp.]|jgi:GNAT superfamily N-acetyltransferase|nr:acetyltransferase [Belnapia sp.]
MNARIRPAGLPDLPHLRALYRHLTTEAPAPDEAAAIAWRALLATPGITVFLAEAAGEAVATCTLIVTPNLMHDARPYALIENVVTHAAHRRRGHGQAVLRAALAAAWAAGCYKVSLMTGSTQEATWRFYAAAGFRPGEKTAFVARPPTAA